MMNRFGSMLSTAVMAVVFLLLASSVVSCAGYADGAIDPTGSTTTQLSDPTLARTPPMGFNNWNAFGCDVSETLIKETADFFVVTGLKDLGYTYVNIDDCWSLKERGEDGRLVPDPEKFPSGIKGVANYVHDLGLKLGIYGDAGTKTCAGYPGSLGYEELDAQTWAEWGVDYVKYDNCYNQSDGSLEDYIQRYAAMRDALTKTGRPIVYSICEWGQSKPWEWAQEVGHLWRTTGDIHDSWTSLRSIIEKNLPLAEYAGPGHWNDPDMLEIGNGGMTATEYRTHMSMWAMMAAPLIIGTDLRTIPEQDLAMLSNKEIIAIDQDPLGVQGAVVYDDNEGLIVVDKPLATSERAIALYNSTDVQATISVPVSVTGLKSARAYRLHDVWIGQTMEAKDTISAGVPAHGTVVYRVRPTIFPSRLPPAVSIGGTLDTVIVGLPEGATLTTTAINHGMSSARHVEITVEVPEGWTATASSATQERKLATGDALITTWNVRAPEGAETGRYPITVTATYTWHAPFFWWSLGKKEVSVTTELTSVAVSAPTDGTTHLSLLFPVRTQSGLGPVEIDQSNGGLAEGDGNLISVNGRIYTRGIGTQAASEIVYYLGGRCSSLTTDVGIDDSASEGVSGAFAVYADDVLAEESGPITVGDDAQTLTVDLSDATWLRLVTETDSADAGVPTDWAMPQIVCGDSTEPTTVEVVLFSFETLEEIEPWTVANVDDPGSMAQSSIFHTDGEYGLEVVSPPDGNWFGQSLEEPLDLSAYSMLKFDLKTGEEGTVTEVAFHIGEGLNWCAGGLWTWTDAHSTKTMKAEFSGIECSAGIEKDLTDIRAIWLFVKAATVHIDNVRVE